MRQLFALLIVAGLVAAACVAPPAAPAPGQPATQPSQPEVTVFRSPT